MSKSNGYVPIDKNLTQELNNIGRSFTRLEAMFSYTVDQDNGKGGSINGYANQWNWSRNKTRKFLKEIRTVKGHSKDTRRTPDGHPVHFIDKALWVSKDSERTVKGHSKDSERYTTNNPNPFPNPNPILKSKKKTNTYCAKFELFWNAFADKRSKEPALKSWNQISDLTEELCEKIIEGAKRYALERKSILARNGTPKMAQGWLTDRRWEDEIVEGEIVKEHGFVPHWNDDPDLRDK